VTWSRPLSPSTAAPRRPFSTSTLGGVNGHKLVLTTDNDQSNPTTAASLLLSALSGSSPPDDVIPGISSNEGLAMAPLLTRYKVVGLGSASDASLDNPAKYPYFFSQSTLANTVTADGATWIATHPGVKKVVLITSNDALGQADVPTLPPPSPTGCGWTAQARKCRSC
jgi:ABC-type branched-subunit amino acid transport system substrate-binding protein